MDTNDKSALTLERLDADGAIRETAEEATATLAEHGDTRLDFLKKAGIAGGAVMGGGALLGALVPGTAVAGGRPPKSFGKGDIGILNYALTLEYLEAAFYTEATRNNQRTPFLTGESLPTFLKTVTEDEKAHVKALKQTLGKKAVKKPKFDFGSTTSSEMEFIATAVTLENTGVSAYSGQVANIKDAKVLKAAASIVTVEARHASVIGLIQSGDQMGITPNGAFDKALSAKKVLKAVEKTGFITG
jgi:rubrerythrin